MTNPQHEPAPHTPLWFVRRLIEGGVTADEASAVLLLQDMERRGALPFIVPGSNMPAPQPIDYCNNCAWNRRTFPATRVSVTAPLPHAQAVLNSFGQMLDKTAGAAWVRADKNAMKHAIRAAIGAGHERAAEVLQAAQHEVQARALPVFFAATLDAWREKFAAGQPGPGARPWLPVSPDECEALGSADGCTPGGEVPRSPVWRIDTTRGLAERQDGHGTWRPVGPVTVDGAALRAIAAEHVASSPAASISAPEAITTEERHRRPSQAAVNQRIKEAAEREHARDGKLLTWRRAQALGEEIGAAREQSRTAWETLPESLRNTKRGRPSKSQQHGAEKE